MAYKNPLNEWLDRTWSRWETNFERLESRIQIIFTISLAVFPMCIGFILSGDTPMTPIWIVGMGVSFWAMVISGMLLLRNTSKTETNRRLQNIESKLDTLIEEIRADRNERRNKHE